MRLFLIGYMCSGKTTLGRYLANKLNMQFIDLDEYIEEKENLEVSQIFEKRGENIFRQLEHLYLKEISEQDNIIVATGGGAPCCNNNMKIINTQGISVYLYTSHEVLIERLLELGEKRPLVKGKTREELNKFVVTHLKSREPYYQEASIMVNVDIWNIEEIATKVLNQLEHLK